MTEQPLWVPGEDAVAASNMTGFMRYLSRHYGAYMADARTFMPFRSACPRYSGPHYGIFAAFAAIKGPPPYIVDGDKMPGAQFFPHARLNFAENMLATSKSRQGHCVLERG